MKSHPILMRVLLSILLFIVAIVAALVRPDIPADGLEAVYGQPPSQFAEINGQRVHFRDEGDGPPLLLIHGALASLHTWDGWVEALGDDFRLIRFDLPGHGLTGPSPDGRYGAERDVAIAVGLLDYLGVERASVAGNSLGGEVAWRLALTHPNRVDRLILIDSAGFEGGENPSSPTWRLIRLAGVSRVFSLFTPRFLFANALREVYGDDSRITPALVDRYYELVRREGNREAALARLSERQPAPTERLSEVTAPTLILWGSQDRWIPVQNGPKFEAALPNARLIEIEGAGHVPMEERPEQTAALARQFLRP